MSLQDPSPHSHLEQSQVRKTVGLCGRLGPRIGASFSPALMFWHKTLRSPINQNFNLDFKDTMKIHLPRQENRTCFI